jgi:MATE family multidrug resistance protein
MGSALETLCGQAYGAKQYHMLGVYMQRSCIVLFVFAVLLLPTYIFATPILKLLGQADDIAELSGSVSSGSFLSILHLYSCFQFRDTCSRS